MAGPRSSRPVTLLLLAAITNSALGQIEPRYFVIGEALVLTPPKRSIISIVWTHNTNLVADWLGDNLAFYGEFKGRTSLNVKDGTLTINNTTAKDEGELKVEINNLQLKEVYKATATKKVPVPSFVLRTLTCSPASANCTFTCEGDPTGAEPVTYSWRKDQRPWEREQESPDFIIKNEGMSGVTAICCRMKNPVTQQQSKSLENPFYLKEEERSSTGLIVGLCILFGVLSAVGVAVWKREDIKKMFFGNSETSADKERNQGAGQPLNDK